MSFKNSPETKTILAFLNEIGIAVFEKEMTQDCFLPGLSLGPNCIYIDYDQLLYPGDILHEAGHLAVTKASERLLIDTPDMPKEWPTQGDEIVTMLWSYAALVHLQLPIALVFHPEGYKGQSDWLIENFETGNYLGLPLLEWMGLATSTEKAEQKPFPAMIKWMRD